MTEKEALKTINDAYETFFALRTTHDFDMAMAVSIQALEKQIPKKVIRVKLRPSEWGSEYRCPICESELIPILFSKEDGTEPDEKISWCPDCGQKLNWRDNDDN